MEQIQSLQTKAQRLLACIAEEITSHSRARSSGEQVTRDKALRLLQDLGVTLETTISPEQSGVTWDGEVLFVRGLTASDLLHELAHFQCAPATAYGLPDFGLGLGSKGNLKAACQRYSVERVAEAPWEKRSVRGVDEEISASFLGILWERWLGAPFWNALVADGWGGIDEKDQWAWGDPSSWQCAADLMELGLINTTGKPNLVLRDGRRLLG
jgi:hypothetical protein|tara:strand:+ start:6868 stop:7503 length:636 start_codon:yes stop_codon:yes gene_type:complete